MTIFSSYNTCKMSKDNAGLTLSTSNSGKHSTNGVLKTQILDLNSSSTYHFKSRLPKSSRMTSLSLMTSMRNSGKIPNSCPTYVSSTILLMHTPHNLTLKQTYQHTTEDNIDLITLLYHRILKPNSLVADSTYSMNSSL